MANCAQLIPPSSTAVKHDVDFFHPREGRGRTREARQQTATHLEDHEQEDRPREQTLRMWGTAGGTEGRGVSSLSALGPGRLSSIDTRHLCEGVRRGVRGGGMLRRKRERYRELDGQREAEEEWEKEEEAL